MNGILKQGVNFNKGVSRQAYQGSSFVEPQDSFISKVANTGVYLADAYAKHQNDVLKKDLKVAINERDNLIKTNQDIAEIRTKDKIDADMSAFKNSLVGEDFLNEGELLGRNKEYENGVINIISNDKILTVEQKQGLKAYAQGKTRKFNEQIYATSYKARRTEQENNLLNNIEDTKILIMEANTRGDIETANELTIRNRENRKKMEQFDKIKYNKEWQNKEDYTANFEAGMGRIHKIYNDALTEFDNSEMTEKDMDKLDKTMYETYRKMSDPKFLGANYGEEAMIVYPEFLEKGKAITNKFMEQTKSRARAKKRAMEKIKQQDVFKTKRDSVKEYLTTRNLDVPNPTLFENQGDLIVAGYNTINKSYLDKNNIHLESNGDLEKFLRENPDAPRMTQNLFSSSNLETLLLDYRSGNFDELLGTLDSYYGSERTQFLNDALNLEMSKRTNGELNLTKLDRITRSYGEDTQNQNIREAFETTLKIQNLGLNQQQVNSIDTSILYNNIKILPKGTSFAYSQLSKENDTMAQYSTQLNRDVNSVATVMAFKEMTESQVLKFKQGNSADKTQLIEKVINGNEELKAEVKKYSEGLEQGYFGDDRPYLYNGYGFMAEKGTYNEDYLESQLDKISSEQLYLDSANGQTRVRKYGTDITKRTRFYANDDNTLNVYIGEKPLYRIVDGKKELVVIQPIKQYNEKEEYNINKDYFKYGI